MLRGWPLAGLIVLVFITATAVAAFVLTLLHWFEEHKGHTTQTVEVDTVVEQLQKADIDHSHPELEHEIPVATNMSEILHPVELDSSAVEWGPDLSGEIPVASDATQMLRPVTLGTKQIQWGPDAIPVATDLNHVLRPVGVGSKELQWDYGIVPAVASDTYRSLRPALPVGGQRCRWANQPVILKSVPDVVTLNTGNRIDATISYTVPAGLLTTGTLRIRMGWDGMQNHPDNWLKWELIQTGAVDMQMEYFRPFPTMDPAITHMHIECYLYVSKRADHAQFGRLADTVYEVWYDGVQTPPDPLNPVERWGLDESWTAGIDPAQDFTIQWNLSAGTGPIATVGVTDYTFFPDV